jgi:hypothetical protein
MSLIIELPIRSVPLGFRTSLFSVGVLVDKCASSHSKVNGNSSAILHLPENTNLENIIIQVGSNDCVSDDFDKVTFREEYCALVEIARSASDPDVYVVCYSEMEFWFYM